MYELKAPAYQDIHGKTLFVAGGISGCPDWQQSFVTYLAKEDITLFNPRRDHYADSEAAVKAQIHWEHEHLKKADAISFWFPKETLCPITLYELGAWSKTDKQLFIGIHPDYARKQDVEIQTALARPDTTITYDLKALAEQVHRWARNQ